MSVHTDSHAHTGSRAETRENAEHEQCARGQMARFISCITNNFANMFVTDRRHFSLWKRNTIHFGSEECVPYEIISHISKLI